MTTTAAPDHTVVIVGGGPTGLMLAAELALAGVDVAIVERRADQTLDRNRAGGLHARTLEVLDQRGVAQRFLDEGRRHPAVGFAYNQLDITDAPSRHNLLLALAQPDIERILTGWAEELGVPILRRREVVGLTQDDDGVDVALADGTTMRAAWLVGCDGGRSLVRKAAGIAFVGLDPSTSWIIAEVELDDPVLGVRPEGGGIGPATPGADDGRFGVVVREPDVDHPHEPTLDELRAALDATYGSDFGARAPTRLARFSDVSRQAAAYRAGRVLLAGDAAHVHPPQGGQGLNLGVQDAVNLGWKLALVAQGTAGDALLDTYHDERHPVGARVLDLTSAQVALATPDERHAALRATVAELLAMDEPRRRLAAQLAGLDVRYDLGDAHPLLGRRMPDVDLTLADGTTVRAFELLHDARPVLVHLGGPASTDAGTEDATLAPGHDRLRVLEATADATWDLPVIGSVDAPPAMLIRPDGHVAWTGTETELPLAETVDRWFGDGPAPTQRSAT